MLEREGLNSMQDRSIPAFEMYGTADGGAGAMMFNTMPLPGKDPLNLPGEANRGQKGSATI
jgi:hypothetical protein